MHNLLVQYLNLGVNPIVMIFILLYAINFLCTLSFDSAFDHMYFICFITKSKSNLLLPYFQSQIINLCQVWTVKEQCIIRGS